MSGDDLILEVALLTQRQALLALAMLPTVEPIPAHWRAALSVALAARATGIEPLSVEQTGDLRLAAIQPDDRADWLRAEDFARAHAFVVTARLAAEFWMRVAIRLLDDDESAKH